MDAADLTSDADPIHPARIYGDLLPRLDDDAVVIGDGGDFVSFAGKYVEPAQPRATGSTRAPTAAWAPAWGTRWPRGVARPDSQVVLLMGDGAAGFSLMDVDTLVRHDLPVVMVVGNNKSWGLEKHPMKFLYGYDVIADLRPARGTTRSSPRWAAPARPSPGPATSGRHWTARSRPGVPYLVNVMTDTDVAYPRSTTGIYGAGPSPTGWGQRLRSPGTALGRPRPGARCRTWRYARQG